MSRILWLALLVVLPFARVAAQDAAAPAADAAPQPAADSPPPAQPAEQAAPAPSPEAVAAREAFDAHERQWRELFDEMKGLRTQRDAAVGEARAAADKQLVELQKKGEGILGKLADAGLAVYKADPEAYPEINNTVVYIAQFYITGDPKGDGGDQYEKALALIKGLIEAGGDKQWPQLYTLGAVAAYNTQDFALAEEYFGKARQAGASAGSPPIIEQMAAMYQQSLPAIRKAWEKEEQIRAAEAKADNLPRVKLTTTKGDIVLELFENEAPQAVANFITLVKQGFYDGVTFHRVLPGFMAQGGDPQGTGQGGPGWNIRDEHRQANYRRHFRGSLSMAKTQAPNSGGSQFFLTFVPTSSLDGKHTAFGRIVEGMDIAASIKRRDPDGPPPLPEPDKILKAEVLRDRGHAYEFEKLPER